MDKLKYTCNQCSFKCTLIIHTVFINPYLVCPKEKDFFKWKEVKDEKFKDKEIK